MLLETVYLEEEAQRKIWKVNAAEKQRTACSALQGSHNVNTAESEVSGQHIDLNGAKSFIKIKSITKKGQLYALGWLWVPGLPSRVDSSHDQSGTNMSNRARS